MKLTALTFLALAFSATGLAAPPTAPVVTVGAASIKQLQFDWASVPQTNRYELWFKANTGAQWVKYSETPAQSPRIRISVSVHLLDWRAARYRVAACNPSGCINSAEVGVTDLGLDAAGYLKPQSTAATWFGHAVAMSADGTTAAVVASETVGSSVNASVISVYRKTSATGGWRREARLVPDPVRFNTSQPYIGNPLTLSGDGNVLAYGAWYESAPGSSASGAVYVFRRSGTTWTQQQRLDTGAVSFNYFGWTTDLDDAGTTLAVLHQYPRNQETAGPVEIYHSTGGAFTLAKTLPPPPGPDGWGYCESMSLSGDGQTLARTCTHTDAGFVQILEGADWVETARLPGPRNNNVSVDFDGSGTRFALRLSLDSAEVWSRESGAWAREAQLSYGRADSANQHNSIAISRDGKLIAAGDEYDAVGGSGIVYPPLQAPEHRTGGVYVFERKSAGWSLRRLMKPVIEGYQGFGHAVALGDNGRALIVGAFADSSAATGIDGDPNDDSAQSRGAAWLY